jgi:hypothetical protein
MNTRRVVTDRGFIGLRRYGLAKNGQGWGRCGFRTMAIRIPKRCRSRLRSDADHDSDAMPITNRDRFGMVIDMS